MKPLSAAGPGRGGGVRGARSGPVLRPRDSGRPSRRASGLLAIGVATIVARRPTIFHLLGLLVAENGIALAAVSVPGGLPLLIELGVAFDLIVVITVATAFHERIFGEFGTGDTAVLRDLRD